MIAQSQNGRLVTCTATLNDVTISNVSIAQFGAAFAAWFATLPTSDVGQPVGAFINSGGTLQQVQS